MGGVPANLPLRVRNTYVVVGTHPGFPNRSAARVGVAALFGFLMWLGTTLYSNGQHRIEQQYAEIDPYQWIKAMRQMETKFAEGFAKGVLERLRPAIPNSTLTLAAPPAFDDLGLALRAVVQYTAEIDTDAGGTTKLEAEVRSYFHPHGVAVIESGCLPELLECEGMQQLRTAAEDALLPRLNSSQLAGILPDGKCATESVALPNSERSATIMTCLYTDSEAASSALARNTLGETRLDMRSRINETQEFKRAVVKRVLST